MKSGPPVGGDPVSGRRTRLRRDSANLTMSTAAASEARPNSPTVSCNCRRYGVGCARCLLPQGVAVGSQSPAYTIVGTYPVPHAYNVLNGLARKGGQSSFPAPRGGFAVYSKSSPTNIYLAYPGSNLQIEVYDPSPKRARSLINSGRVAPVH